jgi:heme oxygenase
MSKQQVMISLREATADFHAAAEKHPVQKHLVAGVLSREGYVAWLGQMLEMHQAFEPELERLARSELRFARILERYRHKRELLEADLSDLGAEAGVMRPTPAAEKFATFVQRLADDRPFALLGVAYVFEGSTNGGKFLAKAVRHAYGLTCEDGTRYLDPYGPEQAERWNTFRQAMNEAGLTHDEIQDLAGVACATFRGIIAVLDELHAMPDAPAGAAAAATTA